MATATDTTGTPAVMELSKRGRERRSYDLNTIVSALNERARRADAQIETILAELAAALADDGVIDAHEARALKELIYELFKENVRLVGILSLLDASPTEHALREVERVEGIQRKVSAPGTAVRAHSTSKR